MKRMNTWNVTRLLTIALGIWCCILTSSACGADRLKKLPDGWTVVESVVVPQQQLTGISSKLGGTVARLSNTTLAVDGQNIKVNVMEGKTEEDAAKLHASLLRIHQGNQSQCPREGKTVIELVAKDQRLIERAYQDLGIKPPRVTYSVSFQAAPIEKCDYMQWNKMFNAFLVPQPNETLIQDLSKNFTFGEKIRVRSRGVGKDISSFAFTPAPRENNADAEGDLTTYSFANLPRKNGLPAANVVATVTSESFAFTPSNRKAGQELLGTNEFWPTTDPNVVKLAQEITKGKANGGDKATAILEWLMPGKNIRYAGEITGSRYGVNKVLQQRFGHCWDFSDCFVTLCRASGVPSRQVLGWLYGQSGHVWAEVLIDGKGWRQVDPTAGMGCDSRYIPLFANEDGKMPIVYTSSVRITPK